MQYLIKGNNCSMNLWKMTGSNPNLGIANINAYIKLVKSNPGSPVQASPVSLWCALEQDKFLLA